mmetsp:Transcript_71521/g.213403  ORF Transcript_71521/g.213403 Transcript_71521/m.213403 type:complete len:240 (+) Transcript_71521:1706-2425(+)
MPLVLAGAGLRGLEARMVPSVGLSGVRQLPGDLGLRDRMPDLGGLWLPDDPPLQLPRPRQLRPARVRLHRGARPAGGGLQEPVGLECQLRKGADRRPSHEPHGAPPQPAGGYYTGRSGDERRKAALRAAAGRPHEPAKASWYIPRGVLLPHGPLQSHVGARDILREQRLRADRAVHQRQFPHRQRGPGLVLPRLLPHTDRFSAGTGGGSAGGISVHVGPGFRPRRGPVVRSRRRARVQR